MRGADQGAVVRPAAGVADRLGVPAEGRGQLVEVGGGELA